MNENLRERLIYEAQPRCIWSPDLAVHLTSGRVTPKHGEVMRRVTSGTLNHRLDPVPSMSDSFPLLSASQALPCQGIHLEIVPKM